jgi:hypothetical protein
LQTTPLRLAVGTMGQPRVGASSTGAALSHDILWSIGEHLQLRFVSVGVRSHGGSETRFKLPRDRPLREVVDAYSAVQGRAFKDYRFLLDGESFAPAFMHT